MGGLNGDVKDFLRDIDREADTNGHLPEYLQHRLKTRLSDIDPEEVQFLWEKRIPLGKVTVIDGDPGLGKSVLGVDLAARVTTGRTFPDGSPCESGGVVMFNVEDGFADTVRPRLDAAGGNPDKVLPLSTVPDKHGKERAVYIPEDIPLIRHAIKAVDAVLLIIDPLMAFLSPNVNAHKDQQVRQALAPLVAMAAETRVAVCLIRHLNKAGGGNPLYPGGGSIGIVGAARSGLMVAEDPEDDGSRILAVTKQNLAEKAPSLRYRVVSSATNGAARIEWTGESQFEARDLVAEPQSPEERTALDDAKDFLREELAAGPVEAKRVIRDARDNGISERTLRRAKTALRVDSVRRSIEEPWSWVLPEPPPDLLDDSPQPQGGQGGQYKNVGNVGSLDLDVQDVGNVGSLEEVGNNPPTNLAYLSKVAKAANPCKGNVKTLGRQGVGGRRLTEEEARKVQKLISEGMSAKQARAKVLGEEKIS